ncbi:hypothetical protein FRC09_016515 [Ceratobasidium sp. 395]|nr:hypothetical protein FRC09_016515 [Ceratobasidium sp. 395]
MPGPSNNSPPLHTSPLQLRDRSGSLGVLPIQLPPPIITSVRPIGQLNDPNRLPASPALVVGAMASPRFASLRSPLRRSISEADDLDADDRASLERRRASLPHLFGSRDEPEDGLDDIETPTSVQSHLENETAADEEEDLGVANLSLVYFISLSLYNHVLAHRTEHLK